MESKDGQEDVHMFALIGLLMVAVDLLMARAEHRKLREELLRERAQRLGAEDRIEMRDAQMSGALEKIQELQDRVDQLDGS